MYLKNEIMILEETDHLSFLRDGEPPKSMRLDDLLAYFERVVQEKTDKGEVFFARIFEIDLVQLRALYGAAKLVKTCQLINQS